jgi:hypothetical protein
MSIQRWGSIGPDDWTTPSEHGKYVLYADHVAAVDEYDGISERYFQQIRNDATQPAREAVAALPYGTGTFWPKGKWLDRDEALAAIDAAVFEFTHEVVE